jgi:hypothetical protein
MTIQFDGLWDVKEFMLMVDIYQWCDKQEPWGGKGYSIQDCYTDEDWKEKVYVKKSTQSKVIRHNGYCIIITPYYKMLSWLFDVLRHQVERGYLAPGILLSGFSVCCEEYFKKTPEHSAKELMLYVLENLQRINDEKLLDTL